MEWNGHSLVGKTYNDVHDIIADSRHEPQVIPIDILWKTFQLTIMPYPKVAYSTLKFVLNIGSWSAVGQV